MTEVAASISSSIYPTAGALTLLLANSVALNAREDSDGDVATQVLKVNIYYANLQYDLLTESPAITMIGLLGSLGGTLGNKEAFFNFAQFFF